MNTIPNANTVCRKMKRLGLDMSSILASDPGAVCEVLLGSSGLVSVSANLSESQDAIFSLEMAMRVLPDSFFPTLFKKWIFWGIVTSTILYLHKTSRYSIQRKGCYLPSSVSVAEAVMDKYVRGARGRFKIIYLLLSDQSFKSMF